MKSILLIDGDQFVFKATAALEREVQWDDQNHVLYSNANECWANLTSMLDRVFERFTTNDHALCFSAPPNFRLGVDPTYKGNRKTRKPLCYAKMRELVEGEYNCVSMTGLEADDVMGILATKPEQGHSIIVSQDKDMKTIPATVWDGKDLVKVTEGEADLAHMMQTLTGDTSDGYRGCPGVGPVKAEKIMLEAASRGDYLARQRWAAVKTAYSKVGLNEADALQQARLARILRWTDWDSEKKTPILWTPAT